MSTVKIKWSQPKEQPPWTRIFIEVVLRALIRLHHQYLLYNIDQRVKEPDFTKVNSGPGLAYADEITVCSAIAQEFLATRYVHGVYIEGSPSGLIKQGERYYTITREYSYPNCQNRADFYVERKNKDGQVIGNSTFIEAKRAYLWSTKLDNQPEKPESLKANIKDDINKLRTGTEGRRGYILVWNIQERFKTTDITVADYFKEIQDEDFIPWQIRLVPLSSDSSEADPIDVKNVSLNYWLWVVLAEVTPLQPDDLPPTYTR